MFFILGFTLTQINFVLCVLFCYSLVLFMFSLRKYILQFSVSEESNQSFYYVGMFCSQIKVIPTQQEGGYGKFERKDVMSVGSIV